MYPHHLDNWMYETQIIYLQLQNMLPYEHVVLIVLHDYCLKLERFIIIAGVRIYNKI